MSHGNLLSLDGSDPAARQLALAGTAHVFPARLAGGAQQRVTVEKPFR
jgi:ABC-type polar amino acid transport system ATPase subunit